MRRSLTTILIVLMLAPAAYAQMTPTFRGKLYNAAYYGSVPNTWASYLMQLNVGGVSKFQVDASGNLVLAGTVTAAGVLLGAGGAGSPGGADTQVQFNDATNFGGDAGMTYNKATDTLTLAGNLTLSTVGATVDGVDVGAISTTYAPLASPSFTGNVTMSTVGGTVDGIDLGAIPTTYAPIDGPTFTTGITTPAIKVTGGTPGAGKVLTSDANGDGAWGDLPTDGFGSANMAWTEAPDTLTIGTALDGATVVFNTTNVPPLTQNMAYDVGNSVTAAWVTNKTTTVATPSAGFGQDLQMQLESSTTDNQPASRIETQWLDATHATRRAQLGLYVSEAHGEEVGLRVQATTGTPNVIGGYSGNTVTAGNVGSFIGGGGYASNVNSINGDYSVIGGGYKNVIAGAQSVICGGRENSCKSGYSTVAGGFLNNIEQNTSEFCSILGGYGSKIAGNSALYNTILGGVSNYISSGADGTIVGGLRAHSNHTGAFLFADFTADTDFASAATNEFAVRASGGVRFVTNPAASTSAKTFAPADVNTSNEQITITSHGFVSGQRVRFTSTATLPGGLAINIDYWITVVDEHTITVSAEGFTATPVNLTSGGTAGATHTATAYAVTQTSIDAAGIIQPGGGYKSADGTAGMTDTRSWDDADGNTHAVTIKNGLITAWTVTPP